MSKPQRDIYHFLISDLSKIEQDFRYPISIHITSQNDIMELILFPLDHGFKDEDIIFEYDSNIHSKNNIIAMLDIIHSKSVNLDKYDQIRVGFLLRTYAPKHIYESYLEKNKLIIKLFSEEQNEFTEDYIMEYVDPIRLIEYGIQKEIKSKYDTYTLYKKYGIFEGSYYIGVNNRLVIPKLKKDFIIYILDNSSKIKSGITIDLGICENCDDYVVKYLIENEEIDCIDSIEDFKKYLSDNIFIPDTDLTELL